LPEGIYGRYDDMLVIRGENVYPSAIEDVLRRVEGFGGEFQIANTGRACPDSQWWRNHRTAKDRHG
jgi:phenylacetate-CoA ligase